MNWGMVGVGLFLLGVGIYRLLNVEATVKSALRRHDIRPSQQADVSEYPRTFHRYLRVAVTFLGVGAVTAGWGVLGWGGDSLAVVLFSGFGVGAAWAWMA